jgi:hypothetical protein
MELMILLDKPNVNKDGPSEFLPAGPFLHTGRQALFAKPVSPAACAEKVVISHPIPLIFEISP